MPKVQLGVFTFVFAVFIAGGILSPLSVLGRPLSPSLPSKEDLSFLRRFGYLPNVGPNAENLYKEETIKNAVKTMQKFGGLPETGVIDGATRELFTRKRCGVPDVISADTTNRTRAKRYIIGADGWNKRHLTYFLANWSPKLGDYYTVLEELRKAFAVWSDYSRLHFTHISSSDADIVIFFARGPHGDGYPLDGPGNVLAHAFFPYDHPVWGGDVHFDEDEDWEVGAGDGVDFFTVAAHEIGHSLGLAHSPVRGSLMFPYYKGHDPNFQLDYDDILAVYHLYIMRLTDAPTVPPPSRVTTIGHTDEVVYHDDTDGGEIHTSTTDDERETSKQNEFTLHDGMITEKPDINATEYLTIPDWNESFPLTTESIEITTNFTTVTTISTSPTRITPPDLCMGTYDAITLIRNEIFVFKEGWVWRFRKRGSLEDGYPVTINQLFHFPQRVDRIDAVYERETDNNIIIFTGSFFWVFDGDSFVTKQAQPLAWFGLPDSLDAVDAAFVWGKNKKTYFFRKDLYWRYNGTTQTMDEGYPLDMSRWRGIPSDVDTAFRWLDGNTYFFKGDQYYRFNDPQVYVDSRYPLSAPVYWFGCPEE